jgi:hypothetical protein
VSSLLFFVLEMLFLAAAHWLGGPPWTALGAVAVVVQAVVRPDASRLLLLVPAVVWLGLFRVTGNRELFFPYAMALTAFVILPLAARAAWQGRLAGGLLVGAFLAIRIAQQAGGRVLAVELAVAAVILGLVLAAGSRMHGHWPRQAALVTAASLAAYAGLAL